MFNVLFNYETIIVAGFHPAKYIQYQNQFVSILLLDNFLILKFCRISSLTGLLNVQGFYAMFFHQPLQSSMAIKSYDSLQPKA